MIQNYSRGLAIMSGKLKLMALLYVIDAKNAEKRCNSCKSASQVGFWRFTVKIQISVQFGGNIKQKLKNIKSSENQGFLNLKMVAIGGIEPLTS